MIIPASLQSPQKPLTKKEMQDLKKSYNVPDKSIVPLTKDEIDKFVQEETEKNKQDILRDIEKDIAYNQERFTYYNTKSAQTSGQESKDAEDNAILYGKIVEELKNVRAMEDLGNYNKNEILGYAYDKARAWYYRDKELSELNKKRKELAKQIQQEELTKKQQDAAEKEYQKKLAQVTKEMEKQGYYGQSTKEGIIFEKVGYPKKSFQEFKQEVTGGINGFEISKISPRLPAKVTLPYEKRVTISEIPMFEYKGIRYETELPTGEKREIFFPPKGEPYILPTIKESKSTLKEEKFTPPPIIKPYLEYGIIPQVDVTSRIQYEKSRLINRYVKDEGTAFLVGTISGIASIPEGMLSLYTQPIQTAKGIIRLPYSIYSGEFTQSLQLTQYPQYYGGGYIAGILASGVVAKQASVKKLEAIKRNNQIRIAIDKAKIREVYGGDVTIRDLAKLKIPLEEKIILERLLAERGNSARKVKVSLKAAEGYASTTPNLKGVIIEVTDAKGNVIKRAMTGQFRAEIDNKVSYGTSVSEAIYQVTEEGKVKGVSDVISQTRKGVRLELGTGKLYEVYKKPTYSSFLQDITLDKIERKGSITKIDSTIDTRLIKQEPMQRFKQKQGLLKEYGLIDNRLWILPDFEKIKSEPYSKTMAREFLILKEGQVDILPEGLSVVRRKYKSVGMASSKKLGETITAYHGTTGSAADKILKEGFKSGRGQIGLEELPDTYLTIDKAAAEGYANRAAVKSMWGGDKQAKPSVLKVELSKTDFERITREQGIGRQGEFKLKDIIPERISSEEAYPSYVGGEGGLKSESIYFGKRTKQIPTTAEVLVSPFLEEFKAGLKPSKASFLLNIPSGLLVGSALSIETGRERLVSDTLVKPIEIEKTKNKLVSDVVLKPFNAEIEKERLVSPVGLIPAQTEAQAQKLRLKQQQTQKLRTPITPSPRIPITPRIYPEEFFFIDVFQEERKGEEKGGYKAQAYIEATKPKKSYWKTLNKKPLTKRSAVSLAAEYVDDTISARGRVIKSKSKEKPIDTGKDYFNQNMFKFRTFKQKRGVRTKLPNSFIEKQKYRLDRPMEIRGIQAGKNFFGF